MRSEKPYTRPKSKTDPVKVWRGRYVGKVRITLCEWSRTNKEYSTYPRFEVYVSGWDVFTTDDVREALRMYYNDAVALLME